MLVLKAVDRGWSLRVADLEGDIGATLRGPEKVATQVVDKLKKALAL